MMVACRREGDDDASKMREGATDERPEQGKREEGVHLLELRLFCFVVVSHL